MTHAPTALVLPLLTLGARVWCAPIDPSIDDPRMPFCYLSRPSTVLGIADGSEGTQVTPEGWLYTGSAQLMFFAGSDLSPLRQRIHTLRDEHLPIVTWSAARDGVKYQFTMFATTLDGRPESNLINFVRVTMSAIGSRPATAIFAVAVRGEGPHCCAQMRRFTHFLQASYSLTSFFAARDKQLLYTFPSEPRPRYFILPDIEGRGPVRAREAHVLANAPVCMVRYDVPLRPGEAKSLDFKMPYSPVAMEDDAAIEALRNADLDQHLKRTEQWWHDYLSHGLQIELPEPKVVDTFLASIVYDSIARDKVGEDYICKVNEFQYDGFWVRDGAYICAAFDLAGRHQWAEQCLQYFLKWQQKDDIIYQPPQLDGWGQALWAFGQHWRLTGDDDWARRVFPNLARSVRGIFVKTRQDPLGLVSVAPPYDNEAIFGHYTGHSLWLMIGLRDIIAMAHALGYDDDAAEFQACYDEYRDNFLRALGPVTARTGGYLPPGLDAEEGCDWGNLLLLYPRGGVPARGNFSCEDPRVAATVDTVRNSKYAEGIMTYGRGLRPGLLHHYLTIKLTHNLVAQNRQQDALADFYAILAHTTSTHGGFEFGVRPWDNRDSGGNFPPHGWFAAQYIALLRNMLVREWEGDLHLFTVLSPEWVKPGATLAFQNAPTDFGRVSARARFTSDSFVCALSTQWRTAPFRVVVHIPWFMQAMAASADGRSCEISPPPVGEGQQIFVPPDAKEVRVTWRQRFDCQLNYRRAVDELKREYRARFEAFTKEGGKPESLWLEAEIPTTQAQRRQAWELLQDRCGIALGCPATASKSDPGTSADAAVDGVGNRETHWAATPYPQWWQVDLGQARKIEAVRVITYWDDGHDPRRYKYRVLVSSDGQQWATVADMSQNEQPSTPAGFTHHFPPVNARYVRVEMLHNSANVGVHLAEVMVFPGVDAPVVEAPANAQPAWTAEDQSGSTAQNFPQWWFVGAERIILRGDKIKAAGDRVCLHFCAGQEEGISISDVSIGATDLQDPRDVVAASRVPVTFGGANFVDLPPGKPVASDWIRFHFAPGRDYAVTFAVLRIGAATLWPHKDTLRFETSLDGAARLCKWSSISPSTTYNIYFLERIDVPAAP